MKSKVNTKAKSKTRTKNKTRKTPVKASPSENGDLPQLKRRDICGYVAIAHPDAPTTQSITPSSTTPSSTSTGWLYLRKHSTDKLFIGNLPWPIWVPFESAISDQQQTQLKAHMAKLIPAALSVESVFSTSNGRLAARVDMVDEHAVDQTLARPSDHVYLPARDQMHRFSSVGSATMTNGARQTGAAMNPLQRWLEEHEQARDVTAVTSWSNAAMKTFEEREKQEAEDKAKRDEKAAVPDEDGFITVTKGAPQMLAKEASQKLAGKGRYKSKTARNRKSLLDVDKGIEKSGFYRWQRKNENALAHLRDKFRGDQKRVAALRGLQQTDAEMKPN